MTYRAVEVLRSADLILAEDTRTSGVLLKHYGIDTKMRSYHAFNEHETVGRLASEIASGVTMALITDAGTPGISDRATCWFRLVFSSKFYRNLTRSHCICTLHW